MGASFFFHCLTTSHWAGSVCLISFLFRVEIIGIINPSRVCLHYMAFTMALEDTQSRRISEFNWGHEPLVLVVALFIFLEFSCT